MKVAQELSYKGYRRGGRSRRAQQLGKLPTIRFLGTTSAAALEPMDCGFYDNGTIWQRAPEALRRRRR
jgi:hypothetical protein